MHGENWVDSQRQDSLCLYIIKRERASECRPLGSEKVHHQALLW